MDFSVCPQKHPFPIWWKRDFCLRCDYEEGIEKLKVISEAMNPGSFPEYAMSPQDVPTSPNVPTYVPVSEDCECGRKRESRRTQCSACRKAAYRGRST